MVLDIDFVKTAGKEQTYREEIAKDISVALGGPADKVQVTSLRAGSIIAEVVLYDGLHPHGLSPTDTFYALRTQLSMPDSPLKGGMHTKYALDFRILHRAYPNEAYKRAQDVHNPPSADDGFSRSRRGSVTARAISPVVGYLDGKLPADVDLLSAGIGLIVREDESGRKIVEQVIPGGSAHRSGRVALGDCITHVNASDVSQLSLEETLLRIKGPEGSSVKLCFMRQEQGRNVGKASGFGGHLEHVTLVRESMLLLCEEDMAQDPSQVALEGIGQPSQKANVQEPVFVTYVGDSPKQIVLQSEPRERSSPLMSPGTNDPQPRRGFFSRHFTCCISPQNTTRDNSPSSPPKHDRKMWKVHVHSIEGFSDSGLIDKTPCRRGQYKGLYPYVKLICAANSKNQVEFKTQIKNNAGGTAVFDEAFAFELLEDQHLLTLQVWDKDTLSDDFLGEVALDLRSEEVVAHLADVGAVDVSGLRHEHGLLAVNTMNKEGTTVGKVVVSLSALSLQALQGPHQDSRQQPPNVDRSSRDVEFAVNDMNGKVAGKVNTAPTSPTDTLPPSNVEGLFTEATSISSPLERQRHGSLGLNPMFSSYGPITLKAETGFGTGFASPIHEYSEAPGTELMSTVKPLGRDKSPHMSSLQYRWPSTNLESSRFRLKSFIS